MEPTPDALSIRGSRAGSPRSLSPISSDVGRRAADAWVALLLFAAATVYLGLLPHSLAVGDEARFLYEAKRIRDGDVMYRDFFQFSAPLPQYLMAGFYWLFGTTVTTACLAMAVVHGATVAVLYAAARRLAVRPALAAPAALAYLALCQTVYPFVSWHWFGSFCATLLLLVLLAVPWAERPRAAGVAGVTVGVLIGVQHQKGIVLGAGVVLLFALDHLIDRRYATPEPWRRLAQRLVALAAGAAAVVGPLLAIFWLLAGPATLYASLIRFPLENYRTSLHSPWGAVMPIGQAELAARTFPALVKYSPTALVLPSVAWLADLLRGRRRRRVRALTVLIVWCAFSILSIWYYPDLIHVAFVAAGFWLCAAVGLEWMLSAVSPPAASRLAGALVAGLVTVLLVVHLGRSARHAWQRYPIAHDTAFGRVDFASGWQPIFVDRVRALLAQSPAAELYCHSPVISLYLTTGARNPTPYQFLYPSISPAEHMRDTLAILQQRRVAYITLAPALTRPEDPVAEYVKAHYEVVPIPEMNGLGEWPAFRLYRRKDGAPSADG